MVDKSSEAIEQYRATRNFAELKKYWIDNYDEELRTKEITAIMNKLEDLFGKKITPETELETRVYIKVCIGGNIELAGRFSRKDVNRKNVQTPSNTRKEVKRLINCGKKFLSIAESIHPQKYLWPDDAFYGNDSVFVDNETKDFFDDDLPQLQQLLKDSIYKMQLIDMKLQKIGKKGGIIQRQENLIEGMAEMYSFLTGKKPTVTYDNDKEEYTGVFLEAIHLLYPDVWTKEEAANIIKRKYPSKKTR